MVRPAARDAYSRAVSVLHWAYDAKATRSACEYMYVVFPRRDACRTQYPQNATLAPAGTAERRPEQCSAAYYIIVVVIVTDL